MKENEVKIYDPETGETTVSKVTEEILEQMRLDIDYQNLIQDKKRFELEEKQLKRDLDEVGDTATAKRDMEASIKKTEFENARRNVDQVLQVVKTVSSNPQMLYSELLIKDNEDVLKKILKTNLEKLINN